MVFAGIPHGGKLQKVCLYRRDIEFRVICTVAEYWYSSGLTRVEFERRATQVANFSKPDQTPTQQQLAEAKENQRPGGLSHKRAAYRRALSHFS